MADSVEAVVYEEAQRGLALQVVLVNELRARTGTLLAVTVAINAFLGAAAIDEGRLSCWGGVAIAAMLLAIGLCVAVLLPREWTFYMGAKRSLENYSVEGGGSKAADRARRGLALYMETAAKDAASKMRSMQHFFAGATVATGVAVASWLIEYGS